jgi:hypothetical protein
MARHGTEQTPLPLLRRSVYSVAKRLTVGYLATHCCVIQQWVDMSQHLFVSINKIQQFKICNNISESIKCSKLLLNF